MVSNQPESFAGSIQHELHQKAGSSDDVTFFASCFSHEEAPWLDPGPRLQHAPAAQGHIEEHQGRQQGRDMCQSQG